MARYGEAKGEAENTQRIEKTNATTTAVGDSYKTETTKIKTKTKTNTTSTTKTVGDSSGR